MGLNIFITAIHFSNHALHLPFKLLLFFVKMNKMEPLNVASAAWYLRINDVIAYFDAEEDKHGHMVVKFTSVAGDIINFIREKERTLRIKHAPLRDSMVSSLAKGKFLKTNIIEKPGYKIFIPVRFADLCIMTDITTGKFIKKTDILSGMKFDILVYAKEWSLGHRIGYTLYLEAAQRKLSNGELMDTTQPTPTQPTTKIKTKKSSSKTIEEIMLLANDQD